MPPNDGERRKAILPRPSRGWHRVEDGIGMSDRLTAMRRYVEEFRRRHVFKIAAAYLVAGWFLVQLASSTFGPLGLPEWSQRALIIAIAVGFVPACVLAWIFDVT